MASAKVFDSGPGPARYLAHVYAKFAFLPGQTNVAAQTGAEVGGNIGGRWSLQGPYAIYGQANFAVTRYFNLARTVASPGAKFHLARDDWGLAIGPEARGEILMAQAGGWGPSPTAYFVGANATAMPFKTTKAPILRDIVINVNAEHSLGLAGPVLPGGTTKSNWMNYTGTVSFNFVY